MRKVLMIVLVLGCSQFVFCQEEKPTYRLTEISDDPTYGLTMDNPIKVGFGPLGERYFLAQLTGNKGGNIKFKRLGSCCPFKTDGPKAIGGIGMLDRYKIKGKGSKGLVIYMNMYDFETPKGISKYNIK